MKPLIFKIRSGRAPSDDRFFRDDTAGRGMDMALTVLLFLGIGWLLDRWLGTDPVFMIVFVTLGLIGGAARLKYSYDESMRRHDDERTAARQGGGR